MKTGKTLVELAQEVQRINQSKRDFVVPTASLEARAVPDCETGKLEVTLNFDGNVGPQKLTNWSRGQLAQYSEIPKQYLDRIAIENPILASDAINHGFKKAAQSTEKESRLVRTLDGNVRGLLSSRYRILDAHDMLEQTLPVILDKRMNVVSSEVTENKLYLKALTPSLKAEVNPGDVVQHGLIISTSDVGAGSVRVEPLIYRLVCSNGLIMPSAIRKYHVGRNQAEDAIRELLSDKTRELTDAAFWASVRDVVLASMRPENFEREVAKLREAAGQKIENFDLPKVVELTMKATGLTGDNKHNSILAALASGNEGAGLTKWGLVNSITRAAHDDQFSYEQSIEMERAAGLVLELSPKSWREISAA